MAAAGRDVINDAAKALGVAAPGQSLNADELNDCLNTFNRLIDSSNTSKSNIFTEEIATYQTAPNKQIYTIGPTGDWAADRPPRITHANFFFPTSPTIRRPFAIWDAKRWMSLRFQPIFTYPQALYCDYAAPLAKIYFHPIPDAVYTIELCTWQLNARLPNLDAQIQYPPGYEDYWLYNLAERIARPLGMQVPPDVADQARRARVAIQRMNLKSPRISSADFGTRGERPGGFNYFSGEPV